VRSKPFRPRRSSYGQYKVVSGERCGPGLTINQGLLNLSLTGHNCVGVVSKLSFRLAYMALGLTEWSVLDYRLVQRLSSDKNTLSIILGCLNLDAGLISSGREEKGMVGCLRFTILFAVHVDRALECYK